MTFLTALRAIPWWAWAGAALLVVIGWQRHEIAAVTTKLLTEQRDRKDERLRLVQAGLDATLAAKAEGDRRVAATQEILDATQPKLEAALDAADRLPDLNRRVRDATAALRACRGARPGDPAASAGGEGPDETARVLAELRRESDEAEEARTRYADAAGTASERCTAIYDSLNIPPGPAVAGAE